MYQLESFGIVNNSSTTIDNATRTTSTSNTIPNRMNIINPNSTHFEAVVDSQGMLYLRDYVLDQLQPFGIVDPHENA
jgi:hypothetical protein